MADRLEDVLFHYRGFAEDHPTGPMRFGWTPEQQDVGLRLLLGLARPYLRTGELVHDAGCGDGRLVELLELLPPDLKPRYVGTDAYFASVQRARELHPGHTFEPLDLRVSPVDADVTMAHGLFAFYPSSEARALMDLLFKGSRRALVFTLMFDVPAAHVKAGLFAHDLPAMLRHFQKLTRKVVVRTDFLDGRHAAVVLAR